MTFRRTRCAHCKGKLVPDRPGQIVHAECAPAWGEAQAAKREREEEKRVRAAAKIERATDRARKAALQPLSWHRRQAQKAVNAYIRARDADQPCISCGCTHANAWDAGHYRTRGSAAHLALDPRNIHKQCVACNQHLHGNAIAYRQGLIGRYGRPFVEELEADHATRNYKADDFDRIAAEYRAKLRALQSTPNAREGIHEQA